MASLWMPLKHLSCFGQSEPTKSINARRNEGWKCLRQSRIATCKTILTKYNFDKKGGLVQLSFSRVYIKALDGC
jgi:hypothetical protein